MSRNIPFFSFLLCCLVCIRACWPSAVYLCDFVCLCVLSVCVLSACELCCVLCGCVLQNRLLVVAAVISRLETCASSALVTGACCRALAHLATSSKVSDVLFFFLPQDVPCTEPTVLCRSSVFSPRVLFCPPTPPPHSDSSIVSRRSLLSFPTFGTHI